MVPTSDATKSKFEPESSAAELLLVVDAGGTKTVAWLVDSNRPTAGRVLGRGRSSAGNPLSVGFDEATRAITETVVQAQHEAQRPAAPVARAILSIAGAADREMRGQLIAWARATGIARHVAIVSDVLPVLAAGTPNCCGVALISGTGSVAFGRAADGRTTRCGGWGYLLGDEGSGYAIGRAGLRYALDALETSDAGQPLARTVLHALGAKSITELTNAIYRSADPRATIASLAPLLIEAADENEPAAQAMLGGAARDLAHTVARAARAVSLAGSPFPLAVAGGVLVGSKRLRDQLQMELRNAELDCDVCVVAEPLEGCLRLADPNFCGQMIQWNS